MLVRAVKCKQCGDIIPSRANYDYNTCKCGSLSVDGGIYLKDLDTYGISRIIGAFQQEHILEIELNITPEIFYNDWNKQVNEYKTLNTYI